jgi:hypothetical protein
LDGITVGQVGTIAGKFVGESACGDGGGDCGSAGTNDGEAVETMAKRLIYLRHRTREQIFTGDVGNEASNGCVSVLSLNIALIGVVVEAGRIRRSLPVSWKVF